jgi:hypothetical protein
MLPDSGGISRVSGKMVWFWPFFRPFVRLSMLGVIRPAVCQPLEGSVHRGLKVPN